MNLKSLVRHGAAVLNEHWLVWDDTASVLGTLNISNANDKNLHQILHLNLHLAGVKPALTEH